MATGFLVYGQCVDTIDKARDVYWSNVEPAPVVKLSTSYTWYVYKSGSTWFQCLKPDSSATHSCSTLTAMQFASCEIDDAFSSYNDGMILGWGVVSAMAVAYSAKLIKDALT